MWMWHDRFFLYALISVNISSFYSFGVRSIPYLTALETFQTSGTSDSKQLFSERNMLSSIPILGLNNAWYEVANKLTTT
jgi:hypothetical protein